MPHRRDLGEDEAAQLRASLIANCYADRIPRIYGMPHDEFLASEAGERDIAYHVAGRLAFFRDTLMPWLSAVVDLGSADVLEVGAGTGASTVALAEAAKSVLATDWDPSDLRVVRDRVGLHGLGNVDIEALNGAELDRIRGRAFDLVVYVATLEHMTYAERLTSLAAAWALLRPGGHLCVFDTPNRLWFQDGHTSLLPFFHWLPDELAIAYMARSQRRELAAAFAGARADEETVTKLARWGRGVSHHEFDLAIGRENFEAVSSLQAFRRAQDPQAREWWEGSLGGRYQALLVEADSTVPLPFYEDALNLLLRRPR